MSCTHEGNHVEQLAMLQQDLVDWVIDDFSRNHLGWSQVSKFLPSLIMGMRGGGGWDLQGRNWGRSGGANGCIINNNDRAESSGTRWRWSKEG
ncbi:hypothetical protein O181_047114 [Austropuccinia psidii MF-1]|uniref:Uncharacterized protein n=1 Tax=Austropuccinia psidii MF-1 TaxID=1389203 RepID=A0A9Q3HLT3_9BASI|nr:hypothetical protein [Austropuccinia psidii MF-1]